MKKKTPIEIFSHDVSRIIIKDMQERNCFIDDKFSFYKIGNTTAMFQKNNFEIFYKIHIISTLYDYYNNKYDFIEIDINNKKIKIEYSILGCCFQMDFFDNFVKTYEIIEKCEKILDIKITKNNTINNILPYFDIVKQNSIAYLTFEKSINSYERWKNCFGMFEPESIGEYPKFDKYIKQYCNETCAEDITNNTIVRILGVNIEDFEELLTLVQKNIYFKVTRALEEADVIHRRNDTHLHISGEKYRIDCSFYKSIGIKNENNYDFAYKEY